MLNGSYYSFRSQGYEGSLLKVTSKNGKTASPVGFVTFNSRAGADAAKQDLQVSSHSTAQSPAGHWTVLNRHHNTIKGSDRRAPNTLATAWEQDHWLAQCKFWRLVRTRKRDILFFF